MRVQESVPIVYMCQSSCCTKLSVSVSKYVSHHQYKHMKTSDSKDKPDI